MLWSLHTEAHGALRATTRVAGSSRRATLARNTLVGAQVAISMIVLMSAAAFIDTFARAERVNVGFNPDRLLIVQPDFTAKRYRPSDAAVQFTERIVAKLTADGFIDAATWTNSAPLTPIHYPVTLSREPGDTTDITADSDSIAANYFETLGIRLIAGRSFSTHDRRDTPRVAIVNAAMARQLWPNEARATAAAATAVGRTFWRRTSANRPPDAYEVIGVAANSRYTSLWEDRPRVFFPLSQADAHPNAVIVRLRQTVTEQSATIAIHAAVAATDPQLPLPRIQTWPETRDASLVQQRLGLTLFATFSAAMLLLTVVGLYSIMTSRVTQRRKEIGIRLALGATPEHMRRTILTHAAVIATCGLIPGIATGSAATTFIARVLPGLEPSTITTTTAIAATLITIATLATLAPARRAASTDPMRVLKDQ